MGANSSATVRFCCLTAALLNACCKTATDAPVPLYATHRPLPPPLDPEGPITIHYNNYEGGKTGAPATLEVDLVIGADGANSRVAKEIDAGEYDYAIAFQERIRIPGGLGGALKAGA